MTSNNRMTLDISTTPFYEKVNLTKLKYIVDHRSDFEDIIKEQEKDLRQTTIIMLLLFSKKSLNLPFLSKIQN